MTKLAANAGEHARENCPVWADVDPGLLGAGQAILTACVGHTEALLN